MDVGILGRRAKDAAFTPGFTDPINMLMAEYVLATGDRTFMPELERITMEIVNADRARSDRGGIASCRATGGWPATA